MTSLQELQLWSPPPRCPDDPEPPCDILLDDSLCAFQNPNLLPNHLCLDVAAYSTFAWAYERLRPTGEFADHAGIPLAEDVMAWPSTHPLPIGSAALQKRADALGVPVPQIHVDLLAGLAEFDDLELASLIIPIKLPTATITFFGLAEPILPEPDADVVHGFFGRDSLWVLGHPRSWADVEYQYAGHRVTVSGRDPFHDDVLTIRDRLLHWWNPFVGEPLRRGRRRGSGAPVSREEVSRQYWKWMDDHGRRPTQDDLAYQFYLEPRSFKRRLSALYNDQFRWPPPRP